MRSRTTLPDSITRNGRRPEIPSGCGHSSLSGSASMQPQGVGLTTIHPRGFRLIRSVSSPVSMSNVCEHAAAVTCRTSTSAPKEKESTWAACAELWLLLALTTHHLARYQTIHFTPSLTPARRMHRCIRQGVTAETLTHCVWHHSRCTAMRERRRLLSGRHVQAIIYRQAPMASTNGKHAELQNGDGAFHRCQDACVCYLELAISATGHSRMAAAARQEADVVGQGSMGLVHTALVHLLPVPYGDLQPDQPQGGGSRPGIGAVSGC